MKAALLLSSLALSLTLFGAQTEGPQKPTPLTTGADAPLFRLNSQSGKAVTIGGKQETWTILAFYPKALTPG